METFSRDGLALVIKRKTSGLKSRFYRLFNFEIGIMEMQEPME